VLVVVNLMLVAEFSCLLLSAWAVLVRTKFLAGVCRLRNKDRFPPVAEVEPVTGIPQACPLTVESGLG
jgi:hypothetical protein